MEAKNNLKKNFGWNTIGVSLNALTSLFYMIIVTRINGTSEAGVYTYAFSIALLIQTIGTYSGRIFQVSEKNKDITDSDYIYTHFFTAIIMLIVGAIFCNVKDYNAYRTSILMILVLYRAIESIEDSLFGVIQKEDDLYKVGISLILKSVISVLIFWGIDKITENIIGSCIVILTCQILAIFLYDLPRLKQYKFKLQTVSLEACFMILKTGFFTFAFGILFQVLINIPKNGIDSYLDDTSQTIYGIISMPTTVMIMLGQYILEPLINKLTEFSKEKEYKRFNKYVLIISAIMGGIGLVVILVMYFIGIPLIEVIYGISMQEYKLGLVIILIAAIFYGVVNILSSALVTLRKTKGQTLIYLIVDIIGIVIAKPLITSYKIYGAIYTYSISMALLLILYALYYKYEINKLEKTIYLIENKE